MESSNLGLFHLPSTLVKHCKELSLSEKKGKEARRGERRTSKGENNKTSLTAKALRKFLPRKKTKTIAVLSSSAVFDSLKIQ
jgi:hypothetical protein